MVDTATHSQLNPSKAGALDQDAFELKRMMRQQAHEKSFEIQVVAQRTFENEKAKEVADGFQKARVDFDKKLNQMQMNSKIDQSKKINEARLLKMTCRNEFIEEVKKHAR